MVSPETDAPFGGDRKKWQTDGGPLLSVAQQTLEETNFTTAGQLTGKHPHPEILEFMQFLKLIHYFFYQIDSLFDKTQSVCGKTNGGGCHLSLLRKCALRHVV